MLRKESDHAPDEERVCYYKACVFIVSPPRRDGVAQSVQQLSTVWAADE
jgi:hypothetical protein